MSSPETTSSARQLGLTYLTLAVIGWGLNWPLVKLILREWPPLFARGTAGLGGAILVGAVGIALGERVKLDRSSLPRLALASFTNVFAWMGLPTVALLWLTISEGALLVYTMPLWATLLAWPLLGDRPTIRDVVALALGISGIVLLLSGTDLRMTSDKVPGTALMLAAAVLMAFGTVRGRRYPLPLPPVTGTALQVGLGCLPMVIIGLAFEGPDLSALSLVGGLAMVYMAICPMGLCYLGWFASLRRLPPTTPAMGMLLVPLVGVGSANVIVGEALGIRELLALTLTLGAVGLATVRS
ncbi:EamA family transporter [Micromonospora sp. STR1s_5]|nr:EamA family transporter [Micromonospora sp. STR1s_5]